MLASFVLDRSPPVANTSKSNCCNDGEAADFRARHVEKNKAGTQA
jgi:hypothetical protein